MNAAIPYDPWKPAPCADRRHELPCFLCPVCAENLFAGRDIRERPCPHVPLVGDEDGTLYCWDDAMQEKVIEAWKRAARTGADTLEVIRERLEPRFMFFELLGSNGAPEGTSSVTVVVDLQAVS